MTMVNYRSRVLCKGQRAFARTKELQLVTDKATDKEEHLVKEVNRTWLDDRG